MLPEQGSFELGFEASIEVCQREKKEKSHSRVCITSTPQIDVWIIDE